MDQPGEFGVATQPVAVVPRTAGERDSHLPSLTFDASVLRPGKKQTDVDVKET